MPRFIQTAWAVLLELLDTPSCPPSDPTDAYVLVQHANVMRRVFSILYDLSPTSPALVQVHLILKSKLRVLCDQIFGVIATRPFEVWRSLRCCTKTSLYNLSIGLDCHKDLSSFLPDYFRSTLRLRYNQEIMWKELEYFTGEYFTYRRRYGGGNIKPSYIRNQIRFGRNIRRRWRSAGFAAYNYGDNFRPCMERYRCIMDVAARQEVVRIVKWTCIKKNI